MNKIGDNIKQDNFWIDIRNEIESIIMFCWCIILDLFSPLIIESLISENPRQNKHTV